MNGWQWEAYLRQSCIGGGIEKGAAGGKGHPFVGLGTQEVRGLVVALVLHLGARVDVEAQVVVAQVGAEGRGALDPLDLPQGGHLVKGGGGGGGKVR